MVFWYWDCDTYPGDGSRGTISYTWIDENLNQNIEPGDSFKVTYDNCWLDDPDDVIDERFDGRIDYMHYIDVRSPIIYMGANYVVLDNLTRTETVEGSGIYTIDADSETTANSSNNSPDADGPGLWIQFLDYIWL